jgi:hypothetical protein
MIINETLARGLKDRFFDDFTTEIADKYHHEIASTSLRAHKKGKWLKAVKDCMERLERFSIVSCEGGSNAKPYFVINLLVVDKARPYNTWNEKCLLSVQLFFAFDPRFVDWNFAHFNIGEHAILRLFMRSPVQENADGSVMPYSIIKQLRYVPFWSSFWIWFAKMAGDAALREELSLIIPAPDGLFVAHFSKDEPTLEIRTFINHELVKEERKMARDLMIRVSEPLLNSPLSASPASSHLDAGTIFLTMAMSKKLLPHAEALAHCLLPENESRPVSPRSRRLLQEKLAEFANDADAFWDDFESLPLHQFLTQYNHMAKTFRKIP